MYIPKAVVIGFIAALGWAAGWLMYGATTASTSATPSAAATATRPLAARHRAAAGAAVAQPASAVGRAANRRAAVGRRAPAAASPTGVVAGPAFRDAASRRAARSWPTAVPVNQATGGSSAGVAAATQRSVVAPAASAPASLPAASSAPATPPVRYVPAAQGGTKPAATGGQVRSALAPGTISVQAPVRPAVVQQPVRQPRTVAPTDARRMQSADALGTGQLQGAATNAARPAASASHRRAAPERGPRLQIPPFLATPIFEPLPGARSRGVSFMEWESYRLDVAGNRIAVTADDSNLFRNRDGKLNGNTGDTDASGLNIVDATDSVIIGTESADEAPWQTRAAARVDLASAESDSEESEEAEAASGHAMAEEPNGDDATSQPSRSTGPSQPTTPTQPAPARTPRRAPAAAVAPPPGVDDDEDADEEDTGDEDDGGEAPDFPYRKWVASIRRDAASAVNTDDGTTLASGQDALVIGSDGYDDDDVRAAGSNIIITRDDGNVVLGGRGDVNAQIGDSEQGAVIMDIERTLVKGGGAY